jgi:RNA polymerase sigma-70 factor, ECF subfamily
LLHAATASGGDVVDYSALKDEHLLDLWSSQRDNLAFAVIDNRHRAAMLGFAYNRLSWAHDGYGRAQECVQITFLRLSKQFSLPCVRNWLYAVLDHLVIDQLRALGRHPMPVSIHLPSGDEAAKIDPLDEDLSPLEELVNAEMRPDLLLECLKQLSPTRRQMIEMFHLQGLTYSQIVDLTGLSDAAIAGRLHKARIELLNCYLRRLSESE